MPTYQKASPEVVALCDDVMERTHERLTKLRVRIDVLMAYSTKDETTGEPKGPAIKHHGSAALGLIRITSLKDRVAGLADAILYLDGDRWPELSDAQREALIDHELAHLLPKIDKDSQFRTDDAGRPLLSIRPHDFELGGFWDVVERHREGACESASFSDIARGFTQRQFPWGLT